MAHKHSVYDTDPHFSINPITRAIKNESSGKVTLIQGDHNSERFSFDMPRMIEEHDMLQCDKVKVHFINTGKTGTTADAYDVTDFQVSPDGDDTVVFSWLISGHATKHVGPLQFAIEFQCTTDGVVDYAWHTAIFAGISVSTGINNSNAIADEYSDILEYWRNQLFANTNIDPEDIKAAVNEYLEANPVQSVEIDETLKKSGAAADAAAVGTALADKLGKDDLQGAINTALTQAKESGDFKGETGNAATLEIVGADSLPYGDDPTVTEVSGSTAQARRYRIGIPAGKPGDSSESGSGGGAGIDDGVVSDSTTYSSQKIESELGKLVTGINRVESLDTTTPGGLVNLRDLETGLYVLYGYFSPFANSDISMTFDNTMVVVSRKTAGSHLLVFTGLNSKVNFLEILVDDTQPGGHTYTRTDFVMLDMHNLISQVGALDGLSTTDKSTIVAAINELHNTKLSSESLPSAINNALNQAKTSGEFNGADGATYIPAISSDGTLSWTNDAGYENPTPVKLATNEELEQLKNEKANQTGWTAGKNVVTDADGKLTTEDKPTGLPSGGTAGQVLSKKSDTNGDVEWTDPPSSSDMLDKFVIGCIYHFAIDVNPPEKYGGYWEKINGRILIGTGAPENNDDGTSPGNYNYALGSKGGEAECSLEMENLPSDDIGVVAFNAAPGNGFSEAAYPVSTIQVKEYYPNGFGTGVANGTILSQISIGQDVPHNNMQPFEAVNIWKRVPDEVVA